MAAVTIMLVLVQPGWARQDDPRLDMLFDTLQRTTNIELAERIEREIWDIWTASGDEDLDALMMRGIRAMSMQDYDVAMVAFDTIVEQAPDFAEGWNKRATLYWLMGDYEASVADIDATLALEPRHFGALSGLAMIRTSQERPSDALDALDKLLYWHPNSPSAKARAKVLEEKLGKGI
ncbi:MAG: tetratricopeptide repeat protein [Alphaproteobacteria bacterium]|nr:tetratricopeptide repeat protein [Alphaproteobacteria bacterium]